MNIVNIVKNYYNFKEKFAFEYILKCNWFLWRQSWIFSSQGSWWSVTCSFRNHSDILFWCSRNISYILMWKTVMQFCSLLWCLSFLASALCLTHSSPPHALVSVCQKEYVHRTPVHGEEGDGRLPQQNHLIQQLNMWKERQVPFH